MTLASIPPPPFNALELGPFSVRMYGLLVIGGGFLLFFLAKRRWVARGGDEDLADRVGMLLFAAIFIGTRLGYVLSHTGEFVDRPWAVFFVWEGGLAIFGGVTVGIIMAFILTRREGMDTGVVLDCMAPAAALGQAVGRWGNYFNQELFGTPTDVPWALEVEPSHRPEEYASFETFHPTFLYESLYNLCLAAFLFWIERKGWLKHRGSLFLTYLIGYSFGRFWIELIRTDTTFRFLGLSRNNWVALGFFLGGLALLRELERRAATSEREETSSTPLA